MEGITLGKLIKSKTVDFNILAAAIVSILGACGVPVSAEVVTAVFTIGNFALRLITKDPISQK